MEDNDDYLERDGWVISKVSSSVTGKEVKEYRRGDERLMPDYLDDNSRLEKQRARTDFVKLQKYILEAKDKFSPKETKDDIYYNENLEGGADKKGLGGGTCQKGGRKSNNKRKNTHRKSNNKRKSTRRKKSKRSRKSTRRKSSKRLRKSSKRLSRKRR